MNVKQTHEFMKALNAIVEEKGIDKSIVVEAMEAAMANAYKKNEGISNVKAKVNGDTGEIILKLFGNIQMEVIESLLKSRYKIDARFGELKTIYKERPKRNSKAVIHIEVSPNPYWASIGLSIEPLPIGSGLLYETEVSYGYLNNSFQNAVKDAVEKA